MLFSIGNPTVSKSKQNHGIILIPLTFSEDTGRLGTGCEAIGVVLVP